MDIFGKNDDANKKVEH